MSNYNKPNERLIRLLNLIQELQIRPKQTPKELCERLAIKKATFYADKKLLSESGFSWYYDRNRRIYIRDGESILPMLELNLREALAIVLAVKHFSNAGDSTLVFDALSGIKKLISATPKVARQLLTDLLEDVLKIVFQNNTQLIDSLVEAQRSRRCIAIDYLDQSKKQLMSYEIAPYQLFFQARALYLDCYITSEKRIATLRVNRIKKIKKYTSIFEVVGEYDFVERHRHTFRAIRREGEPQKVRLLFNKEVAEFIRESVWHKSEKKLEGTDGSICLELTVSEPKEVLWYLVMPYVEYVTILEPKYLQEELLRIISSVLKKYKSNNNAQNAK